MTNLAIAPMTFPEDMRESHLFNLTLAQGIAEIEDFAQGDHVNMTWPADAIRYYNWAINNGQIQRAVSEDMSLTAVTRPVPRSVFVGVIDAVRNRVLDLALELDRVAPQAGQPDATSQARQEAASVINNYNFGSASNVAIGSQHVAQTVSLPALGDRAGLLQYLGAAGVEPHLLVDLGEAIDADASEGNVLTEDFGPRVKIWLQGVSTQVGTGVATSLILVALKSFFGL